MHDAPLPDLILYGRPDCGLCDEAREMVTALLDERRANGQRTPALVERDIDTDAWLQRDYFATIPVLQIGGQQLELATSLAKIRLLLSSVLD